MIELRTYSLTTISTSELQTQTQVLLEIRVQKWNTHYLIYRLPNNDVDKRLKTIQIIKKD